MHVREVQAIAAAADHSLHTLLSTAFQREAQRPLTPPRCTKPRRKVGGRPKSSRLQPASSPAMQERFGHKSGGARGWIACEGCNWQGHVPSKSALVTEAVAHGDGSHEKGARVIDEHVVVKRMAVSVAAQLTAPSTRRSSQRKTSGDDALIAACHLKEESTRRPHHEISGHQHSLASTKRNRMRQWSFTCLPLKPSNTHADSKTRSKTVHALGRQLTPRHAPQGYTLADDS